MEDFIVRIYRFEKDQPRSLVGLVEKVGVTGRKGFTNLDELWEILNSAMADKPGIHTQKERKNMKKKVKKRSLKRMSRGGFMKWSFQKVPLRWLHGD